MPTCNHTQLASNGRARWNGGVSKAVCSLGRILPWQFLFLQQSNAAFDSRGGEIYIIKTEKDFRRDLLYANKQKWGSLIFDSIKKYIFVLCNRLINLEKLLFTLRCFSLLLVLHNFLLLINFMPITNRISIYTEPVRLWHSSNVLILAVIY